MKEASYTSLVASRLLSLEDGWVVNALYSGRMLLNAPIDRLFVQASSRSGRHLRYRPSSPKSLATSATPTWTHLQDGSLCLASSQPLAGQPNHEFGTTNVPLHCLSIMAPEGLPSCAITHCTPCFAICQYLRDYVDRMKLQLKSTIIPWNRAIPTSP